MDAAETSLVYFFQLDFRGCIDDDVVQDHVVLVWVV
jgi:hypothetical protein